MSSATVCHIRGGLRRNLVDLKRTPQLQRGNIAAHSPRLLDGLHDLTPVEQSEALQCILQGVTVQPSKLALEIFELEEFPPSSQNRKEWLGGLDSNQDSQLQSPDTDHTRALDKSLKR
jgi:hypothetical protein